MYAMVSPAKTKSNQRPLGEADDGSIPALSTGELDLGAADFLGALVVALTVAFGLTGFAAGLAAAALTAFGGGAWS